MLPMHVTSYETTKFVLLNNFMNMYAYEKSIKCSNLIVLASQLRMTIRYQTLISTR